MLADPPYADVAARELLARLAESRLLADEAVVVLEHSAREEPRGDLGPLYLAKELRHGDSAVSIYLPASRGTTGG